MVTMCACAYLPALVCFAVKDEARPFEALVSGREEIRVLVTGMGSKNARAGLETGLVSHRPALVTTGGFAGGLNPAVRAGNLLYSGDPPREIVERLASRGIRRGTFHLADRVAVTAEEKARLWRQTGADAVEMESCAILEVCRDRGIPCLILRVVLDTAGEDLPLDFNALLTPELTIDRKKLAWAVISAPWKIPGLLRLQRVSAAAARELAGALRAILEA